jgi:uncharacterized protein YggE
MADAAGEKLGKLLSISESSGGGIPIDSRAIAPLSTGGTAFDTPIETGELEISVTVSVLYAID